jgi:hypothetical protein
MEGKEIIFNNLFNKQYRNYRVFHKMPQKYVHRNLHLNLKSTRITKKKKKLKTELCGFSPQANGTDRLTAACQRSWCQLLQIEGLTWSVQWIPTAVNLHFLDLEPLLSNSSSSSVILTRLSGTHHRPTTSQKI